MRLNPNNIPAINSYKSNSDFLSNLVPSTSICRVCILTSCPYAVPTGVATVFVNPSAVNAMTTILPFTLLQSLSVYEILSNLYLKFIHTLPLASVFIGAEPFTLMA